MPSDRRWLYTSTFLRALGTGMAGVLLGIYLSHLSFEPGAIGVVIASGLSGAALASLVATIAGDRLGRRHLLFTLGVLSALGGLVVALSSNVVLVGVAAFVGMLNGMGRDRGAALVLEQVMLPATVADSERTRAFAWYNVTQDVGHALGGLLAIMPTVLRHVGGLSGVEALRWSVGVYALLMLLAALPYLRLSASVERPAEHQPVAVSPASRRIISRISALFALDSLGGGFLNTALLAFFFYERFGVSEAVVAGLFFVARLANAVSHLGAAWLAKRIGLVNTMVFTHLPSSLLLMTVPFAPNFWVAAVLFLLRESLVEMDVPTRQSYVMAVVRPEERTTASGITHMVRMAGWAVGPALAGPLMQGVALATPLVIGAGMKVTYDILLYRAFKGLKPPEEAPQDAQS